MIKIKLIALGKIKENYLTAACEEYLKRLSRYCDISVEEIVPENLPDNPSAGQVEKALSKEAEKIEKRIPDNAYTVAFCVEGIRKTSEKFADMIKQNENEGRPLCFIIGSSYGLSEEIKQSAKLKLSLSDMTFPHRLFRVMVLEQIYRAFKINEGGTYHK